MSSQRGQGFQLRMDPEVHERAKLAAEAEGRSLNNFIARAVEAAVDGATGVNARALDAVVASAIEQYVQAEVRARLAKIANALGDAE